MAFDLDAFLQRELATPTTKSRRRTKQESGRASRKQARTRQTLRAVGGYSNLQSAIYAPADTPLCVVVPHNTGWLPDGRPRRDPR